MKRPLNLLKPSIQSMSLSIVLSITLSSAYAAFEEPSDTDCQCRAPGGNMRNLGTVECVDVTGRQYLVRCEMSTNTPYWKKLDNGAGCPLA